VKTLKNSTPSVVALSVALSGCGMDSVHSAETSGEASVRIVIHDGPVDDVDEVWVEFDDVSVHGPAGWEIVSDVVQQVDLKALQDGVVDELGLTTLAEGHYTQVRLHITNAWVVVDGGTYPLDIPSGGQSGVKLVHGFDVPSCGQLTLSLDWDLGAHLLENPQGYQLRPTIKGNRSRRPRNVGV